MYDVIHCKSCVSVVESEPCVVRIVKLRDAVVKRENTNYLLVQTGIDFSNRLGGGLQNMMSTYLPDPLPAPSVIAWLLRLRCRLRLQIQVVGKDLKDFGAASGFGEFTSPGFVSGS